MIRINLLPVRQVRRAQASRRQLAIIAAALIVQIGAMFFLYDAKESEVEQMQRRVQVVQAEIDRLKKEVGDFEKLRRQRDRLLKQRKVINELHKGRTGPVWVLRELSEILTPGKGPTVEKRDYEALVRRDPSAGYNVRWNPRRLWINGITEQRGKVSLVGKAKDHDDVAELLKRLNLSRYFQGVQLRRITQVRDNKLKLKVVKFSMACRVNYKG